MLLDRGQDVDEEGDELEVSCRILAGSKQQGAGVSTERPVVVLSRTVDTVEGLLVQQHNETVLARDLVHHVHYHLVLVVGEVALPEDWSKFELVGSDLVVPGLQGNAEFVAFVLEILHECCDAGGNGREVVVLELLVLGGGVAHQCASCEDKVRPGCIEILVNEEILLLPAKVGMHLGYLWIEELADRYRSVGNGLERLLERCLVVQSFACVRDEHSRYAEGVILDEDGGSRIPSGVTAGLEGGADAAAGEGRGVRLLLNKGLAVEGLDHATLPVVFHQGVMFLGSHFREGLEPVGDVRDAVFERPFLHAFGDLVSRGQVE